MLPSPARRGGSREFGSFSFLGFPTSVRPGFWAFLALLAILYPFPLGLWVALAVALFTLLHEFGHAWMARRAGCTASISLDFMVAYASYRPRRPLNWRQRAAIAMAGPFAQVFAAHLVLLALGANPFSRADITSSDATLAVWWAGVALGLVNLVPVLPLDGGAIVASVVESVAPEKGRDWVLKISFVVTTLGAVAALVWGLFGLVPLLAFMLILQYQTIAAPARIHQLLSSDTLEPTGEPDVDLMVVDALIVDKQAHRAVAFAAASYRSCPAASTAVGAARAAMVMGNDDAAVKWLHVAERSQVDAGEFTELVGFAEELEPLRGRSDVSAQWFADA